MYYLNFPLENNLIGVSDGYEKNQHEVYREVFAEQLMKHIVSVGSQYIGVTHHMRDDEIYVVMINYSDQKAKTDIVIKQGYHVTEMIRGELEEIESFETVIFRVEKYS